MRSLSSTLLAAQKSPSAEPYLKVEVLNKLASVSRPQMERLYNGTEEDFYHATTMPGDDSLIWARVKPTANDLYIQRTVSPGLSSDFTPWTLLNAVSGGANIALCHQGSTVRLFYVDTTDNRSIYMRLSSNYGATWGTPSIVITPAVTAVKWLAADIRPNGDVALFYASDIHAVYAMKLSGGSWSNPVSWSNSVSTITGMACVYQGDWNLAISGQDSLNDFKVWTCIYGDGSAQTAGTWSALMELTTASSDSQVEFHVPFLSQPDVYRLFFVEKYTGTLTYERPNWSHSLASADFDDNLWREPVPFDLASTYGVALAYGNGYLWLSTPYGVWRGLLNQSSLDLTADVLSLRMDEGEETGQATIFLRNDDGRYGGVQTGSLSPIDKGSEVQISPGYVSSLGKEVSSGPALWIRGWAYVSRGAESVFTLYTHNAWALLDHWRARRQYTWDSGDKSVLDILRFVAARVGLEIATLSSSTTITGHSPAFTIHPQEKGTSAIQRLLAMVPDVLFFRGHTGYIKNP